MQVQSTTTTKRTAEALNVMLSERGVSSGALLTTAATYAARVSKLTEATTAKAKTTVTRDNILARCTPSMEASQAIALVRLFEVSPKFLDVWTERANHNSDKLRVLWIPATHEGLDAMQQDFLDGEIAKAMQQKDYFQWTPRAVPRTWFVTNTLHAKPTTYKIDATCCECERFKAAGICKHILAGYIDHMLTHASVCDVRSLFANVRLDVTGTGYALAVPTPAPAPAPVPVPVGAVCKHEIARRKSLDFD